MAKKEFLGNLRTAAGLLSPTIHTNGIRLEEGRLTGLLRRATLWLTRKAVEGFDQDDFPEIPEAERARLARDVGKFREIAGRVAADRPATDEQVRNATPVFLSILAAMWPYMEGFEVYAALKRQRFPDFVRDFAVKVGADSTGDPSAWVWVIVDDQVAGKTLFPKATEVRKLVDEALDRADVNLFPYVMFRTESEQRHLEGASAR